MPPGEALDRRPVRDGAGGSAAAGPLGGGASRAAELVERTWRRLTGVVEAALDSVFDEPLDVRTAAEALEQVGRDGGAVRWGVPMAAAEWTAARQLAGRVAGRRGGRRLAGKVGSKMGGRAVLPVTVAVEVGLAARAGRRELQVLSSFLIARLRQADLPVERDLVRRTVAALYLEPRSRPDLRRSGPQLAAAVARRWATEVVPGMGRRARHAAARVRAVDRLDLNRLVADWRSAGGEATGRTGDGRGGR